MCDGVVAIGLVVLLGFHWYLRMKGMTTFDWIVKRREKKAHFDGDQSFNKAASQEKQTRRFGVDGDGESKVQRIELDDYPQTPKDPLDLEDVVVKYEDEENMESEFDLTFESVAVVGTTEAKKCSEMTEKN